MMNNEIIERPLGPFSQEDIEEMEAAMESAAEDTVTDDGGNDEEAVSEE